MALAEACKMANEYVHTAVRNAMKIGSGLLIANPLSVIYLDANRYHTMAELQQAAEQVSMLDGFYKLIPETQTNFVYALLNAVDVSDVAAVKDSQDREYCCACFIHQVWCLQPCCVRSHCVHECQP
jgi:hydroxymethylpyrimidine/phosphomethylpyrimidine kinase